jgi:beta-phosphoglucomutase
VLCFQQALAEEGLLLTKDEYYGVYLGMDERTCAKILIAARDGICDDRLLQRIMNRKADLFHASTTAHKPTLIPGVVEFVKTAKPTYRLAIASGGRREQIDAALTGTLIKQDFELIISAEDCPIGKPDPAIYRLTCERLNAVGAISCAITPADCLVIEDSLAGIRSAKAAGMRVLALATTYPIDKLGEADAVLSSLHDITPDLAISMAAQNGTECQLPATQPQ